ncbi:MAG: (2Fe-2S)-binding protein [Rubrobacter sp.]|jgi:ferredoxin|nr:(2Fe-2S)-binding protein [Rubrobacter sp.]
MPKLEVEGAGTVDVPEDLRLVLAIEEDAGVDIMHQCGGNAHCATCRVEFLEGEPEDMTEAEHTLLEMRELLGEARLSCQILCEHDMKVRPLMTVSEIGGNGPGGKPEEEITPEPMWIERPD